MELKDYKLANSTYVQGMRVEKGDILRESSTKKTVKVLNVYKNSQDQALLQVEYNAPGEFSLPFQKTVDSFQFLN
ncbi:hypothetical protein EBU91_02755 [bacterium]|nr:hypothetical protein [bacterium]